MKQGDKARMFDIQLTKLGDIITVLKLNPPRIGEYNTVDERQLAARRHEEMIQALQNASRALETFYHHHAGKGDDRFRPDHDKIQLR